MSKQRNYPEGLAEAVSAIPFEQMQDFARKIVQPTTPEPAPLLTALDITTIPIDEQHELRKVDDLWQLFTVRGNSWVRSLNGYESEFVTCAIRSAALQTAARIFHIDTQTHVAVQKMTEAEARKKFQKEFAGIAGHSRVLMKIAYLNALRDIGALLP